MSAPALTRSSEAVAGSPRLLDQVRTLALARFGKIKGDIPNSLRAIIAQARLTARLAKHAGLPA